MASSSSLLLRLRPPPPLPPALPPHSFTFTLRNLQHFPSHLRPTKKNLTLTISRNALTESGSPKSLDGSNPESLLQELAESFDISPDYFSQLPRDLRLDLNDAAFDLSNGPVADECGQELGTTLLNLSRAWETADTSTSTALAQKLPTLVSSLSNSNKSALGKRLVSAGRRFQSMGQYGQGELQRISKAMISAGNLLSAYSASEESNKDAQQESRTLKFGELQVELTRQNAYIGAVVGVIFGIISWELSQGIQSIPESSFQYANDNALLIAKSLRGALLALAYSSTVLSAFASIGLIFLAGTLESKEN